MTLHKREKLLAYAVGPKPAIRLHDQAYSLLQRVRLTTSECRLFVVCRSIVVLLRLVSLKAFSPS
jgi:hypothetical protein